MSQQSFIIPFNYYMKTLILDNYDSFTYNLYQYIAELGGKPVVYRNDEITVEEITKMDPTHIVISPGPGRPENPQDFGVCGEVIKHFGPSKPILGVCLGHQGLATVYGGNTMQAPTIMHGKTSQITLSKNKLFKGMPLEIQAMRYHSLIVEKKTLPKCLEVIATEDKEKIIMGLKHKKYQSFGIQFHPESIGTPEGKAILKNFLKITP